LETKAQGATAIAGVFLGATISILTRGSENLSDLQRGLILAIAALLALAVVLAVSALVPRTLPVALNPENRFRTVRDLLTLDDDTEFMSLLADFYAGEKDEWVATINRLSQVCGEKARFVFGAQLATGGAIIAAVLLVTSMLVK
jgi:hypothetical protein